MGSKKGQSTPSVVSAVDVGHILDTYKEGSTKDFDIFVSQLNNPALSPDILAAYLKELTACVNRLGKDNECLVGIILKVKWLQYDVAVQSWYMSFIVNLLSAWSSYLWPILRMIVAKFMPVAPKKTEEPEHKTEEANFVQLHSLLKAILKVVPSTPTVLVPLLQDFFPYMSKSPYIHECYMKNLLQVTTYLPSHRAPILELIIDRMTKIGVRAPREDLANAEAEANSDNEDDSKESAIFKMDDICDATDGQKDTIENPALGTPNYADNLMAHPEGDRLDIMMDIFFRYIYSVCYENGKLDWEATKKLYRELLLAFENIVLPTHASCHVQFTMFYICSFKEQLTEGFLDYLWKKVQDPNGHRVFRQVAVCYIGSLLSRAMFIPISLVRTVLDLVVPWIHGYISQADFTISKADPAHHGTFYAVCQALLYILIFRHKEILKTSAGYKYLQSLNLQTIVTCRLNPLRLCLPIIVRMFASMTRQHQLAFCDTVLERNSRNLIPVERSALGGSIGSVENPLDTFFPFDPYVLKRSSVFVTHLYRVYEGTPAPDDSGAQDMEEDFEEVMESTPGDMDVPPSPIMPDFLMYGTSPGFQHV